MNNTTKIKFKSCVRRYTSEGLFWLFSVHLDEEDEPRPLEMYISPGGVMTVVATGEVLDTPTAILFQWLNKRDIESLRRCDREVNLKTAVEAGFYCCVTRSEDSLHGVYNYEYTLSEASVLWQLQHCHKFGIKGVVMHPTHEANQILIQKIKNAVRGIFE